MKNILKIIIVNIAVASLLFLSCNSNKDKHENNGSKMADASKNYSTNSNDTSNLLDIEIADKELKEIIDLNERVLTRHSKQRDERRERVNFMSEHKFEEEVRRLTIERDATTDLLLDYRNVVDDLKELLNKMEAIDDILNE